MVLADCHAPLRREDSLECRWTGARDDADALRTSLLASAVAVTWVHEGAPLAFAGVVNEGQAGEGLVWLLTTEAARRRPVTLHRLAVRFLASTRSWRVLRNHVDASYASALRWLRALGFQVAAPAPWGPFGHLFCAVEWSRRC
jgi:hypothetical protein